MTMKDSYSYLIPQVQINLRQIKNTLLTLTIFGLYKSSESM